MQPLFDAYGKELDAALVKQYFIHFQSESEETLSKLVFQVKEDVKKHFPFIGEIREILNVMKSKRKESIPGSGNVSIECSCGHIFNVGRTPILNGGGYVRCPYSYYTDPVSGKGKCNKLYLLSDLQKCKEDPPGIIVIKNQKIFNMKH